MLSNINKRVLSFFVAAGIITNTYAQQNTLPQTESDFYPITNIAIPEGVVLEVGGLVTMPNGSIAVSTRRGEVWIIENPNGRPYYKKFASGLHEILGLAYHEGSFYLAQRGELTKLTDTDNDGIADKYESVYQFPISGHYHEYSYGPKFMPDGSMMVTGNVAFGDQEWWLGESRSPWRGWTMRVTKDGKMEPFATGMRSPAGFGVVDGEFFYAENQGDWHGSGFITHLEKGDFTGHPAGLKWADRPESPVKVRVEDLYSRVDPRANPVGGPYIKPENLPGRGVSIYEIAKEVKGIKTPSVWLPHGILGISTSEIVTIPDNGKFGPFGGQLLVGDQGQSKIARVFLEKVKGQYQGGAILFREGFRSGVLRMDWGHDGTLYVGQTNRGWGSTGPDDYGLQRVNFNGKTPFEMHKVTATPDGFEITFTEPIDVATAEDVNNYEITGFNYKYHVVYGSPVVDDKDCAITGIKVASDGKSVRLLVNGLREKYIHEIKLNGVLSKNKAELLHNTAYYTLNALPDGAKISGHKVVEKKAKVADESHSHHHAAATEPAKDDKKASAEKLAKRTTVQPKSWTKGPDQVFTIGTEPGLKFDKKELKVKAGSKVKLTMVNTDDMPHNFLIVQHGTANTVGEAALKLGLKANEMNYVPNSSNVLYHTKLIGPGSSDTIYFVAPSKPGKYTYVCTYPGHYIVMQGTLTVLP